MAGAHLLNYRFDLGLGGRLQCGPLARRALRSHPGQPGDLGQDGVIVEAEGAILCFIIYLIPGLPKDMVCYLFGISPMPLWVFTLVSTLGRILGTWVLSAQGAHTEPATISR